MAECDALEKQLQQWQRELEDVPEIFPTDDGDVSEVKLIY
jgi:hypothetical protein